uniref:Uncharacterized protein n=1 Tax=Mesocestoides corti TaxID=53468 RepID=A0A5K3ENP0_MESCO
MSVRCLMAVNITVISLILLASLSLQAALAATQEEIFKRFQDCINRCSLINKECNKAILNLWDDFFSNRKTITRHLRKCCLRNEYREDAHPNDSFGACARINCGAMLWGCQIQKKHTGFLSPDEVQKLKNQSAHAF